MDDVARYRARWPLGTPQRLAMEIMFHTMCRRSDAVRFGWQNVKGGRIQWRQEKGATEAKPGIWVDLPISEGLAEALKHAPRDQMTFFQTRDGRPKSPKSFGAWFANACDRAGVSARAHGFRHLAGSQAAERGMSEDQIAAMLGYDRAEQAKTYTAAASRRRMADAAMKSIEAERDLETGKENLETG